MKTRISLLLCLLLFCVCCCAVAEAPAERTLASYNYALGEEGEYVENLIFNSDVVISGDNTQIVFSNCEFNGNIILTASEATRVFLLGCEVNGTCVLRNPVREANLDYAFPKFLCDAPVSVVTEDCVGALIGVGNFEATFNGEAYSMSDAQLFFDSTAPESGFVPYTGQEANYFIVAQWYQNDKQVNMVLCEYDGSM